MKERLGEEMEREFKIKDNKGGEGSKREKEKEKRGENKGIC